MPRKPRPVKRSASRPLIDIDMAKVDELLIYGCNGAEVAAVFGCHPDTLYKRVEDEKGMTFTAYACQKKQHGDSILRGAQYRKAAKGDNSMMIWLGKNRLDQRDSPAEITVSPEAMKSVKAFLDQLSESRERAKANSNNSKDEKSE
jgi:hypothetical protein